MAASIRSFFREERQRAKTASAGGREGRRGGREGGDREERRVGEEGGRKERGREGGKGEREERREGEEREGIEARNNFSWREHPQMPSL